VEFIHEKLNQDEAENGVRYNMALPTSGFANLGSAVY
jgi:hypothetical protein